MIPKIIHNTSNTMTWEERHVMKRSKRMMPDFQHIFWNDQENLDLFRSIFPAHVDAYLAIKRGVVRADISRCLYLYKMGGIYCDTDYLFYKRPDDVFLSHKCVLGIEELEEKEFGDTVGGYKVGNAFMASEQGLPLWRDFIEQMFAYRGAETGNSHDEMDVLFLSGPHALSLFLKKHKNYENEVTFLPASTIYPTLRWKGLSAVRDPSTIGVHLCWGRWRDMPILEQAKQRIRRWGSAML